MKGLTVCLYLSQRLDHDVGLPPLPSPWPCSTAGPHLAGELDKAEWLASGNGHWKPTTRHGALGGLGMDGDYGRNKGITKYSDCRKGDKGETGRIPGPDVPLSPIKGWLLGAPESLEKRTWLIEQSGRPSWADWMIHSLNPTVLGMLCLKGHWNKEGRPAHTFLWDPDYACCPTPLLR